MVVLAGENYTFDGATITPGADFSGTLSVSVQVTNGETTSNRYSFALSVTPANDAPEIVDLETEPLRYSLGNDPANVSALLRVVDADDDKIMLAEIGIVTEDFQSGGDILTFTNTPEIRGVFDPEEGILSLIGIVATVYLSGGYPVCAVQFQC